MGVLDGQPDETRYLDHDGQHAGHRGRRHRSSAKCTEAGAKRRLQAPGAKPSGTRLERRCSDAPTAPTSVPPDRPGLLFEPLRHQTPPHQPRAKSMGQRDRLRHHEARTQDED